MARVSQIYEARAKVSEILRRVTAAASVTTFLVASCGSNSSQPTYDVAIQEGQTAAQELIKPVKMLRAKKDWPGKIAIIS
jgi:hypothetical protein